MKVIIIGLGWCGVSVRFNLNDYPKFYKFSREHYPHAKQYDEVMRAAGFESARFDVYERRWHLSDVDFTLFVLRFS